MNRYVKIDVLHDMSHRYLILGLLSEHPMTGYDVKKHVKESMSTITNASYGTLYPTLHRLLDEGSVEVNQVPQKGRPAKKVYNITQIGRQELAEWLRQPPATDQIRREFLLKVYLAKDLPRQELLTMVVHRRHETAAQLRLLNAEQHNNRSPQHQWVMDYALLICQAEMDWLKQLEAQLSVA